MTRKSRIATFAALLLFALCSIPLFAKTLSRNAVGSWKLDTAKSSYGSAPAPKSEELVVTTDTWDALKWSMSGTAADGKSYTESYDGPIDGQYHPLTGSGPATTVAYRRASIGVLHWTMKDSSGAVVETGHAMVSADEKTLVLKGTMTGPNGKSKFKSVYMKTQ